MFAAMLATACALVPVDPPSTAGRLADYSTRLQGLDATALESEYAALVELVREAPYSISSLKLALLLAHRDHPRHDFERALATLDEVVAPAGSADTELEAIATLLFALIDERRSWHAQTRGPAAGVPYPADDDSAARDAATADRAASDDAVEATTAALERRIAELTADLERERARSREVEAQLEGLIELEQELESGGAGAVAP